ncbi:sulfur carrier protein ThiS [Acidaminobacter sp. JC074]|uniref:sulfur carrier protein ThiS n=1 Tax=Acidaminobacter sp. JC074 TaxID=2530199 RepID=UPI001F10E465|nr:sulfur carrier protein ThiS [Acidaminobacter sp. JC074]MCH4890369.1 sulfur carrier protein ThiS [Acidaminobacter sp. JC074]
MIINGVYYDYDSMTVSDVIKKLQINASMLVVEVNEVIVQQKLYDEMMLKKDDKIEIVSFVGGG